MEKFVHKGSKSTIKNTSKDKDSNTKSFQEFSANFMDKKSGVKTKPKKSNKFPHVRSKVYDHLYKNANPRENNHKGTKGKGKNQAISQPPMRSAKKFHPNITMDILNQSKQKRESKTPDIRKAKHEEMKENADEDRSSPAHESPEIIMDTSVHDISEKEISNFEVPQNPVLNNDVIMEDEK